MLRLAIDHVRILTALAAGVFLFFLLPAHQPLIQRILLAWTGGVALFLALIFHWIKGRTAEQMLARYAEEDENAPVILVVVIAAACLSVVAIVLLLSSARSLAIADRGPQFLLAAVTVAASWMLVPTIFALHYARLYYSAPATERPLEFPRTPMPVYWDFAYFSFTISAAAQTADVSTRNMPIRRLVLVHTIIAFFFNASILGLAINVAAGLVAAN